VGGGGGGLPRGLQELSTVVHGHLPGRTARGAGVRSTMVVMTDDAGGGDRVTKRDAAVDKP
jgi:hypothetical protein